MIIIFQKKDSDLGFKFFFAPSTKHTHSHTEEFSGFYFWSLTYDSQKKKKFGRLARWCANSSIEKTIIFIFVVRWINVFFYFEFVVPGVILRLLLNTIFLIVAMCVCVHWSIVWYVDESSLVVVVLYYIARK